MYFTSTTIITSAVLFRGFKGTPQQITTVVLGFLTICSGVVLLQLSKSSKDVPDAAVFSGDLDQFHTIAEQEQPETEPKADAIRGTAALVRRISQARMRMEADELKRLHEEKMAQSMASIGEDGTPEYEFDGLRRRRTMAASRRARAATSPHPPLSPASPLGYRSPGTPHFPLGMSRLPSDEELEETDHNPIFASIAGTIRGRAKTNATMPAYDDEHPSDKVRSPLHPVPLTEIVVPKQRHSRHDGADDEADDYYGHTRPHIFYQDTAYRSTAEGSAQGYPPTPPPHGTSRQFSFNKAFRRHTEPTEEERVGLVKEEDEDEDEGGHDHDAEEHEPRRHAFI